MSDDSVSPTPDFNELIENRQLINTLIQSNNAKEGDIWYIISTDYLSDFLKLPVSTFAELVEELGPIDCTSIVDANGNLYPENNEPIGTYNISPEVFHHLDKWFGRTGDPVTRCVIINDKTGSKEVERFPPVFYVHILSKKPTQNPHVRALPSAIPVTISRTHTFNDLFEAIRINVLKLPKATKNHSFRLWFIESKNINDYPLQVSLATFINDVSNKILVNQRLLFDTLKNQGVLSNTFHILVEQQDNKLNYPVDLWLSQVDFSQYDLKSIMSKSGNLGLNNLGNTCYMNSALQCLLHVPEINYYFMYNLYKRELNPGNPLGNHGDVANSFGALLNQAFDSSKSSSSISPREFKSTIGRYSSMFSGYLQQDSQEFLSWLLDALHEDLNRIHTKPYCEKPELKDDEVNDPTAITRLAETCWNQHKLRNDSVITDLFTGLYQSTLVCPTCEKTSVTFDPFNDLTLPLPVSKKWYHTFTLVDLSDDGILEERIMKLEVELNKNSNYDDLLKYFSNFLKLPTNQLFLYEMFRNSFYTDFQLDYSKNKFLPISDIIRDSDEIHVYCIPHDPSTDIILPVFNSVADPDKSYKITELFAIPLFIVVNKETEVLSFGTIRRKLEQKVRILSKVNIEKEYDILKETKDGYVEKKHYNANDFPLLPQSPSSDDNEPEEDGYDSDISLANPYISSNVGFTIKYLHESLPKAQTGFRGRFNFSGRGRSSSERFIHVPLYKPGFNDFKPLADQLPDLKRKYYHYPDFSSKLDQEMEDLADEVDKDLTAESEVSTENGGGCTVSSPTEPDKTADGFVLVDQEPKGKNDTPQSAILLSDEDTESEPALGSLLYDDDSNSALPLPPASAYASSTKPSNENSPAQSIETPVPVNSHPVLLTKDTILLCDWDSNIYQQFFESDLVQTWENVDTIPNPQLEHNKEKFERQRNSKVSLYDCLKSFSTPEVLGEHDLWYCSRCKDHKQATKTIQLWSTGDILTIHLKRFHSARAFSDKIDLVVDFPIEGLDINEYVSNPEDQDGIYDLIAVDNHYGGLGGGHYTASVKNFRDDSWYYFNDSRVSKINDPQEVVTNAAYLLFYRKRKDNDEFHGGEKLKDILQTGHEAYQKSLVSKKKQLEQLQENVQAYATYEDALRKAAKLEEELQQKEHAEDTEQQENADDDADDNDEGTDDTEQEIEKLSRPIANLKNSLQTPKSSAQFKYDEEEDIYEDDNDNIRKQRLISKENNNNKLVQIKGNGKLEVSSSPILGETTYDDNISEVNDI